MTSALFTMLLYYNLKYGTSAKPNSSIYATQ